MARIKNVYIENIVDINFEAGWNNLRLGNNWFAEEDKMRLVLNLLLEFGHYDKYQLIRKEDDPVTISVELILDDETAGKYVLVLISGIIYSETLMRNGEVCAWWDICEEFINIEASDDMTCDILPKTIEKSSKPVLLSPMGPSKLGREMYKTLNSICMMGESFDETLKWNDLRPSTRFGKITSWPGLENDFVLEVLNKTIPYLDLGVQEITERFDVVINKDKNLTLPLESMGSGTVKLVMQIPYIVNAIKSGKILFLYYFSIGLHPNLYNALVERLFVPLKDKANGQVISIEYAGRNQD